MMKYSFDDFKRFQFGGKISRKTRKILFKNNIGIILESGSSEADSNN